MSHEGPQKREEQQQEQLQEEAQPQMPYQLQHQQHDRHFSPDEDRAQQEPVSLPVPLHSSKGPPAGCEAQPAGGIRTAAEDGQQAQHVDHNPAQQAQAPCGPVQEKQLSQQLHVTDALPASRASDQQGAQGTAVPATAAGSPVAHVGELASPAAASTLPDSQGEEDFQDAEEEIAPTAAAAPLGAAAAQDLEAADGQAEM
jgi:hypothetical protein